MKTFTIVIPVRNAQATLRYCLDSLGTALYPEDEVIIVDDASQDKSREIAKEYCYKLLELKRNQGPAYARTIGARKAQGEYVIFIDADVIIQADTLQRIRNDFNKLHVECVQGVFSSKSNLNGFYTKYKNLYSHYMLNNLPDYLHTTYTSITAVKKKAFFDSGGFDLMYHKSTIEDRTLGMNLVKGGYRIYLNKEIKVKHFKQYTAISLIRNQFNRSRDLIKLLLRTLGSKDKAISDGRFGIADYRRMLRPPLAWLTIAMAVVAFLTHSTFLYVGLLALLYLYLMNHYLLFLIKQQGIIFSLKSMLMDFIDSLVCGLGIFKGLIEFFSGRRY